MLNNVRSIFIAVFFMLSGGAMAAEASSPVTATAAETALMKTLQSRLPANIPVTGVKQLPYMNLFEVQSAGKVYYSDAKGDYFIMGSILDLKNQDNLTDRAVSEINRIRFSELPLNKAIKRQYGKVDKDRVIVLFEDPNCSYCRKLEEALSSVKNLTVYTFLYNVITPESAEISRNIWCSKNPGEAWGNWMLKEKPPTEAPASCKAPNDEVLALGAKLNVEGTPAIIFTDGLRARGAIDAATLERKLQSLK